VSCVTLAGTAFAAAWFKIATIEQRPVRSSIF
jgi:hypothetical protein